MNRIILYLFLALFIMSSCGGNQQKSNFSDDKSSLDDYVQLFKSNSLEGWTGDTTYWRVDGDVLIGETSDEKPKLEYNTFLIWDNGEFSDFDFVVDYVISEKGNSGVNYRSELIPDREYGLKGYQADIDGANTYTGQNYEEMNRTIIAFQGESVSILDSEDGVSEGNIWTAREVVDKNEQLVVKDILNEGWNELRIIAKDNTLQHFINGQLVSEVVDHDKNNFKNKGLLGFQIHTGPPMQVKFKNARIKSL